MRNQQWPSTVIAMIIAGAIVIGLGLAFSGYASASVTLLDPNVSVDAWRNKYVISIGWGAVLTAVFTAWWLLVAHGGRGHDAKTGVWYALWGAPAFAAALLAWLVPPAVKEGLAVPMCLSAAIVLVAYWVATLLLTPDHYRYTPLFGTLLWGRR